MTEFLCARPGCGLPLFIKASGDKAILYHVHDVVHGSRHLRLVGAGGCSAPITVTPGIPADPDPRPKP